MQNVDSIIKYIEFIIIKFELNTVCADVIR